jgi:hypothetical protein
MPHPEHERSLSQSVIHTKKSGLQALQDRLSYPAEHDVAQFLTRFALPGFVTETLINTAYVGTTVASVVLKHELPLPPKEMLLSAEALIALNSFFICTIPIGLAITRGESKQESSYGDWLTVTKRTLTKKSYVEQLFPELRSAAYYGDLHFVGNGDTKKFPSNKIEATREGFNGLFQLAKACASDDPKLTGIDFFAGISPIISKKFNKLGFVVEEDTSKKSFGALDTLILSPLLLASLLMQKNQGIHVPDNKSMAAVITRDQLVANMPLWERLAKPGSHNESILLR